MKIGSDLDNSNFIADQANENNNKVSVTGELAKDLLSLLLLEPVVL